MCKDAKASAAAKSYGSNRAKAFLRGLARKCFHGKRETWLHSEYCSIGGFKTYDARAKGIDWSADEDETSCLDESVSRIADLTQGMGSVLTEHGYIGVVPTITHAEDIRAILFGGQYNYMLLSPGHESPSSYQLLGPSFLLCADMNAKLSHELHKNWINWDSIEQEIYLC